MCNFVRSAKVELRSWCMRLYLHLCAKVTVLSCKLLFTRRWLSRIYQKQKKRVLSIRKKDTRTITHNPTTRDYTTANEINLSFESRVYKMKSLRLVRKKKKNKLDT